MRLEQLRIASANLRANRTRTALTTLGIIIGVASITLVLALGDGIRQTLAGQVNGLDRNVIIVRPGNAELDSSTLSPFGTAATTSLTERDYRSVQGVKGNTQVTPLMLLSGSVTTDEGRAKHVPIVATSQALLPTLDLSVRSGQFIDEQTARDTVVLGHQTAINLYGTDEAMGQSLVVKGRPHTVIGVMKRLNSPVNLTGINLDDAVFVSLDDGKSFNQGIAQIQQLIVRTSSVDTVQTNAEAITQAVLTNHRGERDFTVLAGEALTKYAEQVFRSVLMVTAIISGVTLLVSGIGVMNIMLVGVTERTREIGIRKALGATDSDILAQFMIEALLMCVAGGIIGTILAYSIAVFLGSLMNLSPSYSPLIIASGFLLALIVGIIFGAYPAAKAARKDPISALRHYQ
jgi:ABC-type antimicrobial peptide transport system permease subunit